MKLNRSVANVLRRPAEYTGSVVCADSHAAEYRDWQGSHHEYHARQHTLRSYLKLNLAPIRDQKFTPTIFVAKTHHRYPSKSNIYSAAP